MSESRTSGHGTRKPWILLLLTLLLAAAALMWWVANRPQTAALDPQVMAVIYEANGALENENFAVGTDAQGKLVFGFQQAIPRLEQLREQFPDEELPYRNLAIAWLLMLGDPAAQEQAPLDSEVQQVEVDRDLAKREVVGMMEILLDRFDGPVAQYLYGQLLRELVQGRNGQIEMVDKYQQAAEQLPDHAPFWFLVCYFCEELRVIPDDHLEDLVSKERVSLAALRRLAPQNLWVISKSLVQFAIDRDPQFADYWQQSRPILERANLASSQYRGTDSLFGDYSREFQAIDQALEREDWLALANLTGDIRNTMKGKDPVKHDLQELTPNPLDYLLWRFSEPVMQRLEAGATFDNATLPISWSSARLSPAIDAEEVHDFALADIDFDGHLDLFVLRQDRIEIFLGPLSDIAEQPVLTIPLEHSYRGLHAAYLLTIADSPGSGIQRRVRQAAVAGGAAGLQDDPVTHVELPQIVLWGETGLVFYELRWSDQSGYHASVLPQPESVSSLTGLHQCLLVDFDHDADIDLVVVGDQGLRLLMNRADNTFVDASQWLYLPDDLPPIVDVRLVDWNRDLYIDLVIQCRDGHVGLLENLRHGAFRYRPLELPVPPDQPGLAIAELDGNASWDLVTQAAGETVVQFTETQAWGKVQWLATAPDGRRAEGQVRLPGQLFGDWQVGDFDNSGTQDLLLWRDGRLHWYPGKWQGTLASRGADRLTFDSPAAEVALPGAPRRGEQGDFDGDGDLDVLVLADQKLHLLLNEGGNRNRWLSIVPRGRGDNVSKTNHLGLGSLVEVRVGPHYYAQTVTRPAVHVGLGQATEANLARIIWTNGMPQALLLPEGQQTVDMLAILKGSCPFIYTWDGQQWQFFSDCLWAAPIGLQAASGGLVPTRNWEYLRLPPDSLVESDGTYRLMLTEELWEIAYFDHARLWTIDHPEEIEVQINDKVGPPEVVQHRLYPVRHKISPTAAVDQQGRDVRSLILQEDQRYFRGFQRRITQGFVEPHELILDFDVPEIERHTLFLTGWIQPTDTSINVLLQQHPGTQGPEFPALWVVGLDGQWQPASRPMGFPGGKTKTMAVPLDDLFFSDDHRLKITSSAEIYWDHVYLARTDQPADLLQQEAPLDSARLYYRGTSRRLPRVPDGPELFDAQDVSPVAVWPPVRGPFTPYGEVHELLQDPDDQLVVMGTGDAVELRFKVPSQTLPPGYRRTFLLYTVGYDKDADLHTLEGRDTRPWPRADMPAYPIGAEPDPTGPELAQDGSIPDVPSATQPNRWRHQSWYRFWRQIQNPHLPSATEEPKVAGTLRVPSAE